MAKSLYPNILFHFTNKEGLFGILSSTFRVSYARELIIGPNDRREIGIPMASFCDLKLSELNKPDCADLDNDSAELHSVPSK